MKKIFYEKVGSRYIPVAEYDSDYMDSFPKGNHLVVCNPGGKSIRYHIDPNYAAMIAAGKVAEDAVSAAIVESQELKPQKTPITERQHKLWRDLAQSFNQDDYPLIRPAAVDAGRAAVKAMMEEADKLMTHPSVRKAFDHFILICELTKEHE
jgi:hypothetical protein